MKRNSDCLTNSKGVVAPASYSTSPRDRFFQSSRLDCPWDGKPNTYFEDFLATFQDESRNNPIRVAEELAKIPPNVAHVHGPHTFLKFARFVMERLETNSSDDERNDFVPILNRFFDPSFYPREKETSHNVARHEHMLRPNAQSFLQDDSLVNRLVVYLVQDESEMTRCIEFLSIFSNLSFYDGGFLDPGDLNVTTTTTTTATINTEDTLPTVFGNLPADLHHHVLDFIWGKNLLQFGRCSRATAALARREIKLHAAQVHHATDCLSQIVARAESTLDDSRFERLLQIYNVVQANGLGRAITDPAAIADLLLDFPVFLGTVQHEGRHFFHILASLREGLRTFLILQEPGTPRRLCPISRSLLFRAAAVFAEFETKWGIPSRCLAVVFGTCMLFYQHLLGGAGDDGDDDE